MSHHARLKEMKEKLMCAVECEMCNLAAVNTAELGEAIDMIKDLEEAMYYASITEAMAEKEETPAARKNIVEHSSWEEPDDEYEGHSHKNRKMYMEAKGMKRDKATQLRELEKYMQELTSDIVEMIQDASVEEKQYLEKKISALATKIGSMK